MNTIMHQTIQQRGAQ